MLQRLTIATLAALFATGSSVAMLHDAALHATPAIAASHFDDDEDEHEGHHDHGKHNGWFNHGHHHDDDDEDEGNGHHHHRDHRALRGTITSINGSQLGIRLDNGQFITVNDQPALDRGEVSHLFINERVALRGNFGNDGVFYATRVAALGNNDVGFNNGNCDTSYGAVTTISGIEVSGLDGNGNFQLRQSLIEGVPIPVGGVNYTVHVGPNTCVTKPVGRLGSQYHVYGRPVGDGHTIEAIRITG